MNYLSSKQLQILQLYLFRHILGQVGIQYHFATTFRFQKQWLLNLSYWNLNQMVLKVLKTREETLYRICR